MSVRERLAALQSATEAETPEGGRARTWSDVAVVWAALAYGGAGAEAGQDLRPVRVETATATARDHPAAAAGQQLVVDGDGAPWRVLAVRRGEPAGGRMRLLLERAL